MIVRIIFLLWSLYFQILRAQKGLYEVALPICNSRDRSPAKTKFFNEIIRIANSSFPCSAGDKDCCEDNLLDGNMRIVCNAEANLCEIRTPPSRRPGRQGNLNIVSIARCARPGRRCKLSSGVCTKQEIIKNIFSYLESERLLCAWDRSTDISSIGCMVFDVSETETFPRNGRCVPHIGSSIRRFQAFL
eukprot:IDg1486t1